MNQQNQQQAPNAQNPELGLGDALKFFQAVAEAVLSGSGEVPTIVVKVAGKTVDLGPCPVKIR